MTLAINTQEREEAIARLHEMVKPGDTVRTILRHVSASGMTRWISVVIDGEDYSWLVARAMGTRANQGRHEGIKREGCGMDMGFDLVYSLSRTLYRDGYACIGEGCPANDHSNGDRDYTPGHVVHADGGYALNQRWL